jgi:hypothetical protein
LYCSKACQKEDWKKQHKQICKLLNVGHGAMQVHNEIHTGRQSFLKEVFERGERSLAKDMKRFFKLFEDSSKGGRRAAALEMKKIAKRQTDRNQIFLTLYSVSFLVRSSNSKMLLWPNSPLLAMLQFVDPNERFGDEEYSFILLYNLADLADAFDYSTHANQLILAKQLIDRGANVNAVSIPTDETPLHRACFSAVVTNLDFVELLLLAGADPNAQDHMGLTPLMYTTRFAPGAAIFLLSWPTTDANITDRSGASFLLKVRKTIEYFSERIALPENPDRVQHQFLLQQWREIEEMLMERGAIDTGIAEHNLE